MLGRTLDEQSNGFRGLDVLNKGELLLAERVLVDETSISEDVRRQLVDRVLSDTSTAELKPAEDDRRMKTKNQ
jgi:hypothetical protein